MGIELGQIFEVSAPAHSGKTSFLVNWASWQLSRLSAKRTVEGQGIRTTCVFLAEGHKEVEELRLLTGADVYFITPAEKDDTAVVKIIRDKIMGSGRQSGPDLLLIDNYELWSTALLTALKETFPEAEVGVTRNMRLSPTQSFK